MFHKVRLAARSIQGYFTQIEHCLMLIEWNLSQK